LEEIGYISLKNGILHITSSRELIASSMYVDQDILSKVCDLQIKSLEVPSFHVRRAIRKKFDRQNYLILIKIGRREAPIPKMPRIEVSFALLKFEKNILVSQQNMKLEVIQYRRFLE